MAIPGICSFYITPKTITDLTLWRDNVQLTLGKEIQGNYLYCEYKGQLGGTAILKAPGYEDLEISIYEGPSAYYTMTPVVTSAFSVIKDSTGKTITVNGQPLIKINIPVEYTRVKYIASTGTQYIDTGVIPTSDNIIYEWEGRDDVASGYTSLFASEWAVDGDYSNRVFGGVIHGSKSSRPVYIGETRSLNIDYNSNDNLFHKWSLVINADHTIYLIKDGTKLTTYNWTGSMNKYNTIALFCNHTTSSFSQNASVAYKWFRIKDNGKIVFWGIPVRRNSDSVLGMYDVISETFFDNDGTGTFVTE